MQPDGDGADDASPLNDTAPSGRPIKRNRRSTVAGDSNGSAASGSGDRVSRRRRGGPSLKIIKWRDIPAQVNASSGNDKVQIELPHRFQAAIDRAAMLADKKDSNSYIAEMGQEVRPLSSDDLKAECEQLVADIEAEFTMEQLNAYVKNGGFAPNSSGGLAADGGSEPTDSSSTSEQDPQ